MQKAFRPVVVYTSWVLRSIRSLPESWILVRSAHPPASYRHSSVELNAGRPVYKRLVRFTLNANGKAAPAIPFSSQLRVLRLVLLILVLLHSQWPFSFRALLESLQTLQFPQRNRPVICWRARPTRAATLTFPYRQ